VSYVVHASGTRKVHTRLTHMLNILDKFSMSDTSDEGFGFPTKVSEHKTLKSAKFFLENELIL